MRGQEKFKKSIQGLLALVVVLLLHSCSAGGDGAEQSLDLTKLPDGTVASNQVVANNVVIEEGINGSQSVTSDLEVLIGTGVITSHDEVHYKFTPPNSGVFNNPFSECYQERWVAYHVGKDNPFSMARAESIKIPGDSYEYFKLVVRVTRDYVDGVLDVESTLTRPGNQFWFAKLSTVCLGLDGVYRVPPGGKIVETIGFHNPEDMKHPQNTSRMAIVTNLGYELKNPERNRFVVRADETLTPDGMSKTFWIDRFANDQLLVTEDTVALEHSKASAEAVALLPVFSDYTVDFATSATAQPINIMVFHLNTLGRPLIPDLTSPGHVKMKSSELEILDSAFTIGSLGSTQFNVVKASFGLKNTKCLETIAVVSMSQFFASGLQLDISQRLAMNVGQVVIQSFCINSLNSTTTLTGAAAGPNGSAPGGQSGGFNAFN